MNTKQRIAYSATLAAISTVILTTVLTVWADLNPPLKDALKNAFSHHWLGKSVIAAGVFVLVVLLSFFARTSADELSMVRLLKLLVWTVIVSTIVLVAFFTQEYFVH